MKSIRHEGKRHSCEGKPLGSFGPAEPNENAYDLHPDLGPKPAFGLVHLQSRPITGRLDDVPSLRDDIVDITSLVIIRLIELHYLHPRRCCCLSGSVVPHIGSSQTERPV